MTISEACELVLQASTMGKRRRDFVFDMGKPVKIKDLAIKMIKLFRKKPEKRYSIKIYRFKTGEKLYEELLMMMQRIFQHLTIKLWFLWTRIKNIVK